MTLPLPSEFRSVVAFAPGEQYLGNWRGIPVFPDAQGRLNFGGWRFGPDTDLGLAVLSSYRLRMYEFVGKPGSVLQGDRTALPDPVVTVPLAMIVWARLEHHGAHPFGPLLVLRIASTIVLSGSRGPSRMLAAWRDEFWAMDGRDDTSELLNVLYAAADVAGAEMVASLAEGTDAPSSEEEQEEEEKDGDGPVHFHAESEPDEDPKEPSEEPP